uniref:Copia protein n=1 Tax=Cacopsylla melanoneura TaxID=428564 RepID=A0A8D9F0R1_9HEMI
MDEKYKIPLFIGEDYDSWKFRMKIMLDENGLLKFIEKDLVNMPKKDREANTQLDKRAKSLIVQKVGDSHLEYVKEKETAFQMWMSLANTFERKGIKSQLYLRKVLLQMKFDEKNSKLQDHFLKLDKVVRDLRNAGATMEEKDIICHLLLTLPSTYDSIISALETCEEERLTLSFVKSKLFDEELKRNESKICVSEPGSSSNSSTSAFTSFKCYNCGKPGHKMSNCRFKKKKAVANVVMSSQNENELENASIDQDGTRKQ